MDANQAQNALYTGPDGYVTVTKTIHNNKPGALFYFANPDGRKLHAVDSVGMAEMYSGVEALEQHADELEFCVFFGAYDPVHAGADITEFAGDPDYDKIKSHLYRGTELDTRMKALWPRLRTVGLFAGDRYGGSVEWPLYAQWGVADSQSTIQFTEVHLGIVPGWNGILNTMLKAGGFNALYMGATGNTVAAPQMKKMGLVQTVVNVPNVPDRKAIGRDEWPKVWASHAEGCQENLLAAALDLATQAEALQRNSGFDLTTSGALKTELAERMDTAPYKELQAQIATEAEKLGPDADKDELKALGKKAIKELNSLRKPLAPEAVAAVGQFVADWGSFDESDILAKFDEIGHYEADQCTRLMRTGHRRIGVGAVLSRNPADKIPVFG